MTVALLLARQRSGTGAIGSMLDKQPDVKYVGEVFHPSNVGQDTNYFTFLRKRVEQDVDACLPDSNLTNYEAYIEHLRCLFPQRVIVIDVKYRSLHHGNGGWHGLVQPPWLIAYAIRKNMPLLHLTRKNYVESFVSGRLAEANNVWHTRADDEVKTKSTVVNVRQLSNYMMNVDKEVDLIQRWTSNYPRTLSFDYEDMFDAEGLVEASLATQLANVLEIGNFTDRAPNFVKQAPARVADAIENFELVQQALTGTKHEWMVK